jgi:hypothetical protein
MGAITLALVGAMAMAVGAMWPTPLGARAWQG